MQEIRFAVSKWNSEWQLEQQSVPNELQLSVSLLLLKSNYIDDQLAGIVFLDEILIPNSIVTYSSLLDFERLFASGYITNFKVSDHFSAKVLQPLIIRYGNHVTETLAKWFDAPSVWLARSALGSLVPFANDAIYDELILTGCDKLVRRPEDDAKSVVGSALKALAKRDFQTVENFLADDVHLACINAAGLTKACEPLPTGDLRPRQLRSKRRLLQQQGVAAQAEMDMQQSLAAKDTDDSASDPVVAGSVAEHSGHTAQEELETEEAPSWQGEIRVLDSNIERSDENIEEGFTEDI